METLWEIQWYGLSTSASIRTSVDSAWRFPSSLSPGNILILKKVHPKMKIWKCTLPQAIQDVDGFVSSLEQINVSNPQEIHTTPVHQLTLCNHFNGGFVSSQDINWWISKLLKRWRNKHIYIMDCLRVSKLSTFSFFSFFFLDWIILEACV